jgi:mono/diheme cytochrome c family protein
MKNKIITFLIIGLLFFWNVANAAPDPPLDGKSIFISRCAACHNVNKTLTGPALAGVDERRSIDWIINFVHSSQTMVKKGDKDAVALYEKLNKIPMPDHSDLTAENIKSIVEFIKSESKPAEADKSPFAKPSVKKLNYLPLSLTKDFWPLMGILGSILLLIATLLFAVKVNSMKKEFENKKLTNNL